MIFIKFIVSLMHGYVNSLLISFHVYFHDATHYWCIIHMMKIVWYSKLNYNVQGIESNLYCPCYQMSTILYRSNEGFINNQSTPNAFFHMLDQMWCKLRNKMTFAVDVVCISHYKDLIVHYSWLLMICWKRDMSFII